MIPLVLAAALALQAPDAPGPRAGPDPADAAAWWSPTVPRTPLAADPLQGRKPRRGEAPIPIDNGVEPLLYRLWNLPPLQSQLVRQGEVVLEVWVRPSRGVRQAVARVTRRADGRTFLQARAGFGCCAPEILRRIDIEAELPREAGAAVQAVVADPVWRQPRLTEVDYGGGAVAAVCIDGAAYDMTLVVPGRSITLHRACDDAEVGSAAAVLRAALGPALGRDPRFDYLFPHGAAFAAEAQAYQALIAVGGGLRPAPADRPQAPAAAAPTEEGAPPDAPMAGAQTP